MEDIKFNKAPYSVEAEQAIIGSMLIDPLCVPVVVEILKPTDFYVKENMNIFEVICSMFLNSLKIDPITVLNELKAQSLYDEAGGRSYILGIIEITPTAANVMEYVNIVRDKSMLREIIEVCDYVKDLSVSEYGTSGEIAEIAEQKIYFLRNGREIKGLSHIKNVILELYDEIDNMLKSSGSIPGVSTGFRDLDNFISGLNKSDLILVAARPGMGKTSFALNLALSGAKATKSSVAVFQLEMSKVQLAARFVANEGLIDSKKIKTGDLNDDEWERMANANNTLSKCKILIDDNPAITVAEIKAKCRRIGEDLGLVIIDYLQLMQTGRKTDNRVLEVSEISRSLKIMAKELNVPVVCLSQLSRACEQRANKTPMLSDLRESGAIEQDADIVMFLYRDDYYNEESDKKNVAEVIVSKNRHGETGTVELQWIGKYTIFADRERIHK